VASQHPKKKLYSLSEKGKKNLTAHLKELLNKDKRILFAYVYGSFIENLPFHDIDIGIFIRGISEKEVTSFSIELSGMLSGQLKFPVDIRVLNFAPVPFRFQAVRGKIIFVEDEEAHSQFLEDTVRRYLDIQPIIYHATKEAFAE